MKPSHEHQDAAPRKPFSEGQWLNDFVAGLRFYSRLPAGNSPHRVPDLNRLALLLPIVSLVIGILPAISFVGLTFLGLPPLVGATIAVLVLVLITGAMAEDALADAADGLAGGATSERRLEIMKDSRHGTYGVCALCLFLLLRVVAIGTAPNALAIAALWGAAMILARSTALVLPLRLPPARLTGAAASAGQVRVWNFGIGMALALVIAALLAVQQVGILGFIACIGIIAAFAFGWIALCRRLVGGQTGDLIGALQALIEIGALVALCAFL